MFLVRGEQGTDECIFKQDRDHSHAREAIILVSLGFPKPHGKMGKVVDSIRSFWPTVAGQNEARRALIGSSVRLAQVRGLWAWDLHNQALSPKFF
jgi:hypothetical protein